jgi:hypothetical protein
LYNSRKRVKRSSVWYTVFKESENVENAITPNRNFRGDGGGVDGVASELPYVLTGDRSQG